MAGASGDLVFLYGESVPACTHHIEKQYAGYSTLQYMSAGGVDLRIGARRVVLTHMSADMLERPGDRFPGCERAEDGLEIEF